MSRAVCWRTAVGQKPQRDAERQTGTQMERQGDMEHLTVMEGSV